MVLVDRLGGAQPLVVVLPTPLGPRKPVTTPGRIVRLRSLTATVEP